MPPLSLPSPSTLTREAPLLLGILAAALLLWILGDAWVLHGMPEGYQWSDYIQEAWLAHLRLGLRYNAFRNPLYGGIVALVGEGMGSYLDGSVIIASLSTLALVVCSGLSVRILAGPWAGGAAAVALACVPAVADASRWSNSYPFQAAMIGLGLTLAIAVSSCSTAPGWARHCLVLAAGLATGLAWGVDNRGLLCLPPILGLLALATLQRKGWLLIPLFLCSLAIGPLGNRSLGQLPERTLSAAAYHRAQQTVAHRWVQFSPAAEVLEACREVPETEMLALPFLIRPCARALLWHNLRDTLPAQLPGGLFLGLAAGALVLVPRRNPLDAQRILVVGTTACTVGLAAAFTSLPDRYMLLAALPLSLVIPLGFQRLAETMEDKVPGLLHAPPAVAGLCLAATLLAGPLLHAPPPAGTVVTEEEDEAIRIIRSRWGPQDAFLDCSLHHLNLVLLPRQGYLGDPLDMGSPSMPPQFTARCSAWIRHPDPLPGNRWIGVDPTFTLHKGVRLHDDLAGSVEWEKVEDLPRFQLWRWKGLVPTPRSP